MSSRNDNNTRNNTTPRERMRDKERYAEAIIAFAEV